LKLRINKFLGECLREHNRLDIEQGKKFADEFPNVYSTIFGEEVVKNSVVSGADVGTEIIRCTHSLQHMALSRGFFVDFLVGRIGIVRFNQCMIRGFDEEIKRLTELNRINKATLKMLTKIGVTENEKDAVYCLANSSRLRGKPGARIHRNDNAKPSTRRR